MPYVDSFSKTVTAAGTQEQLSTTVGWVSQVIIRAKVGNTGAIYVGRSTVSSSNPPLEAGASITLNSPIRQPIIQLTDIWIDSAVNGEGVDVYYVATE